MSEKKMKVLFTTNIPVPYRVDFFNEFGKYVDLTVVFERKEAKTRDDKWLGAAFSNFRGIFLKGVPYGDDIAFCPEIVQIIKSGNFDRIIVGAYYSLTGIIATEYMRRKGIEFQFSGDGGFIREENKLKFLLKSHLQSGASLYFSPSNASDLVYEHYGVPKEKMYRYPFTSLSAADILHEPVSEIDKKQLREKLGIKEPKAILGVGRLVDFKAWEHLAHIAQEIGPDVGVYLIGGDPHGSYYEDTFKQYKTNNFYVLPFMGKEKLAKYFMAADAFVFPSRGDIWGLVVNEAMGYGLPVVATEGCVAAVSLIENGINGYVTEVDDFDNLLESTKKIIDSDKLRNRMKQNTLEIIKQYTIENMAKEYTKGLLRGDTAGNAKNNETKLHTKN